MFIILAGVYKIPYFYQCLLSSACSLTEDCVGSRLSRVLVGLEMKTGLFVDFLWLIQTASLHIEQLMASVR